MNSIEQMLAQIEVELNAVKLHVLHTYDCAVEFNNELDAVYAEYKNLMYPLSEFEKSIEEVKADIEASTNPEEVQHRLAQFAGITASVNEHLNKLNSLQEKCATILQKYNITENLFSVLF